MRALRLLLADAVARERKLTRLGFDGLLTVWRKRAALEPDAGVDGGRLGE